MTDEKITERVTPQNLDAEKSLLGAILINDEALADVTEIVKPQDFYDERHRHIYGAMWNLYEHHRPVDILTVKSELKSKKLTQKAGGTSYLAELSGYVPTAANATAYADLVKKAAMRRGLLSAAAKITEVAYDESKETQDVLSDAEKLIFNVSDQNTRTDAEFIGDKVNDARNLPLQYR